MLLMSWVMWAISCSERARLASSATRLTSCSVILTSPSFGPGGTEAPGWGRQYRRLLRLKMFGPIPLVEARGGLAWGESRSPAPEARPECYEDFAAGSGVRCSTGAAK